MKFNILINVLVLILICVPSVLFSQKKDGKDRGFKKATRYFYQKKFEMAEIMLQEVIKKNPENELAYSYLGDIFLKKKRYDGALKLYGRALEINSSRAENYFRIGQVYYYKGMGEISIRNFKKAVDMDKKMKFAYYHIGLTYLMLLRDKNSTITNWETYLQISPEDPQYESIRRVIELLKDPDFRIPSVGSDVSIEEALLLGGATLEKVNRDARDKQAGHETKKTRKKLEELYEDDDL